MSLPNDETIEKFALNNRKSMTEVWYEVIHRADHRLRGRKFWTMWT